MGPGPVGPQSKSLFYLDQTDHCVLNNRLTVILIKNDGVGLWRHWSGQGQYEPGKTVTETYAGVGQLQVER
jgi:hypothetical protein